MLWFPDVVRRQWWRLVLASIVAFLTVGVIVGLADGLIAAQVRASAWRELFSLNGLGVTSVRILGMVVVARIIQRLIAAILLSLLLPMAMAGLMTVVLEVVDGKAVVFRRLFQGAWVHGFRVMNALQLGMLFIGAVVWLARWVHPWLAGAIAFVFVPAFLSASPLAIIRDGQGAWRAFLLGFALIHRYPRRQLLRALLLFGLAVLMLALAQAPLLNALILPTAALFLMLDAAVRYDAEIRPLIAPRGPVAVNRSAYHRPEAPENT